MANEPEKTQERCDTKIWSGSCEHRDFTNPGDKYLCSACGTISNLDHEVGHDWFPHIKGNTEDMS